MIGPALEVGWMKFLKGQGATEYLVLFAVVLVIVMVVVALLGFFPSMGGGISDSSSAAYWSSVRPIQLSGWSNAAAGKLATFTFKNVGPEAITIKGISICSDSAFSSCDSSAVLTTLLQIGDSASATVTTTALTKGMCTAGARYTNYIQITYRPVSASTDLVFAGSKAISGTCAP